MTRSQYFRTKLLMGLGIGPSDKARVAAAFAAHLLRDAEGTLGSLTWEKVERIDDLSSEYWELRKIAKKHHELSEQIEELSDAHEAAQERRQGALDLNTENTGDLTNNADTNQRQLVRLKRELEAILTEGNSIRRLLKGLQTKMEVISDENSETSQMELSRTTDKIAQNKKRFDQLRSRRETVESQIAELEEETSKISTSIQKEGNNTQEKAKAHLEEIGQLNKELTSLRSDLGSCESQSLGYYSAVGKYLLANPEEEEVKQVRNHHKSLFKLIAELRKSYTRSQLLFNPS